MTESSGRVSLVLVVALGVAGAAAIMVSALLPSAWAIPLVLAGAAAAASTFLYMAVRLLREVGGRRNPPG